MMRVPDNKPRFVPQNQDEATIGRMAKGKGRIENSSCRTINITKYITTAEITIEAYFKETVLTLLFIELY